MSPSHAIFFEASHWSSYNMNRSRPLIGQPSFPTICWWLWRLEFPHPPTNFLDSTQILLTAIFLKINHATSSNLYHFYYPHRSRELVSPLCTFRFGCQGLYLKIGTPKIISGHNPPTMQAIASGSTPHMPMFGCHEIFTFQWGDTIFKWNSTHLDDWLGQEKIYHLDHHPLRQYKKTIAISKFWIFPYFNTT